MVCVYPVYMLDHVSMHAKPFNLVICLLFDSLGVILQATQVRRAMAGDDMSACTNVFKCEDTLRHGFGTLTQRPSYR